MRFRFAALALLCVSTLAAGPGCRRGSRQQGATSQPQQGGRLAYGLGHEDADHRKEAAEDLRDNGGPPPDAVPHLLAALQREPDDDARKEMLITLGASGVPDARPVLESYLRHRNDETREGAEKGLELWSKKTGTAVPRQMGEIAKLESPDWEVRREAADDLGDDGGPPKEAVGPLVTAAGKERYPKALGAMLLTLGKSGAPEAKPVIEGHVDSKDTDVRRYARRAQKSWLAKNGHTVRKDVETPAAPPPASVAPSTPTASPASKPEPAAPQQDGCDQFKGICGADPFSLDKCKAEMKPLSYAQQQVWADCVNSSTATCQKAHDTCVVKAKSAK